AGRLVVGSNAAVAELDVAGVPPALVPEDGHQRRRAGGLEGGLDFAVSAFQVGVAVEDEERVSQERQRPADRAGSPPQFRAIERIGNLQAERRAVADGLLHLLSQVAQAEDDPAHPLVAQLAELVVDERPAGHLQQALGCLLRQRSQPGRQAAGQDGTRQSTHWKTTFVPSKSNRNRTSSRPWSAITCRTFAPSWQRNIRNPPPPAPISLPPMAPLWIARSYQWLIRSLLIDLDRPFLCSQCVFISSPNLCRSPASRASLLSRPICLTKCRLATISGACFLLRASCSLSISPADRV